MKRLKLLLVLATMPDEAFSWFAAWALGKGGPFPESVHGFQPASQESIEAIRQAAHEFFAHP